MKKKLALLLVGVSLSVQASGDGSSNPSFSSRAINQLKSRTSNAITEVSKLNDYKAVNLTGQAANAAIRKGLNTLAKDAGIDTSSRTARTLIAALAKSLSNLHLTLSDQDTNATKIITSACAGATGEFAEEAGAALCNLAANKTGLVKPGFLKNSYGVAACAVAAWVTKTSVRTVSESAVVGLFS